MTTTRTPGTVTPCYIADAAPLDRITFTDPRDGTSVITGMVLRMDRGVNGRSVTREFVIFGIDYTFRTSCNYHITIIS